MKEIYRSFIYLLYCAINYVKPNSDILRNIDISSIYTIAKEHSVRALIHNALQSVGIQNEIFFQSYMKSIRKSILFDTERAALFKSFEQCGIWYMPLKGSVLKEIYPDNCIREMADNDILYDAKKQAQVKKIMSEKGYSAENIGKSEQDVYKKIPVFNFEMHTGLFGKLHDKKLYEYYRNPMRLLIKDSDNSYGYHFSDEDFYIYMTAHEWKHYNNAGTGIRSLLDCYVFCKAKGHNLNWEYIKNQTEILGISSFEKERRELALKVFSFENIPHLTEKENEMLIRYLSSGTYGKLENKLKKDISGKYKGIYVLQNMFPSLVYMKYSVGFVRKYPVLYPLGIVYRWGRVLLTRRSFLKQMISAVKKYGK